MPGARIAWRSFTPWPTCPSRFPWRRSCAWQPRRHSAVTLVGSMATGSWLAYLTRHFMRRIYMLDLLIVIVTLVSFLIFIGFTEACERL